MDMRLVIEPLADTPENKDVRHLQVCARASRAGTDAAMREVAIIGVGAHPTGQFTDKPLKELAYTAVWGALEDAGVTPDDVEVAYVGNSLGGLLTGQEGVRGQVVLQHSGITGIPIVNVENACASAATALRGAWLEVASGAADVALGGRRREDVRRRHARARSARSAPSRSSTCRRWASSSRPATRSTRRSISRRGCRSTAGPPPTSPSRP